MAAKSTKRTIEVLLVRAHIGGAGFQRILRKSRNLLTVDLIWPRASIARQTAAREVNFVKSYCDFTGEEWAKRIVFREDVESHTAIAVSVSENLNDEFIEKFLRTSAKFAFRTVADMVEKTTVGISDICSAPFDALAAMSGTYPGPTTIAQGVADISDGLLPAIGKECELKVPLHKPGKDEVAGSITLMLRAYAS
jgi:hypothetical protein